MAENQHDESGRKMASVGYPEKHQAIAAFAHLESHYRHPFDSAGRPAYFLTHLHGVFNDMGLPGLIVDRVTREFGLDWKQLFQELFREEAYCTSKVMTLLAQKSYHLSRYCC